MQNINGGLVYRELTRENQIMLVAKCGEFLCQNHCGLSEQRFIIGEDIRVSLIREVENCRKLNFIVYKQYFFE